MMHNFISNLMWPVAIVACPISLTIVIPSEQSTNFMLSCHIQWNQQFPWILTDKQERR